MAESPSNDARLFPTQTSLSEDEYDALIADLIDLENRLEDDGQNALAGIDSTPIRDQLERLLFGENPAIPDRDPGADLYAHLLVDAIYRAVAPDGERSMQVHRIVRLLTEYVDVFEHVVAGAVDEESVAIYVGETLALAHLFDLLGDVAPTVLPTVFDHLQRYFTAYCLDPSDPMIERFDRLLSLQAYCYGAIGAITAGAGDASAETVCTASAVGCTYYKYNQVLLDLERSHANGDVDPWNAWTILGEQQAKDRLAGWATGVRTLVATLPTEQTHRIERLVSVDAEEYHRALAGE